MKDFDPHECTHGVTFDKEAADKLLSEWRPPADWEPGLAFIMGNGASSEIRKRWPRLNGLCPLGCGYVGIAYASWDHYIAGDW